MLSFQIKTVQNPKRTIKNVENNKLYFQFDDLAVN